MKSLIETLQNASRLGHEKYDNLFSKTGLSQVWFGCSLIKKMMNGEVRSSLHKKSYVFVSTTFFLVFE